MPLGLIAGGLSAGMGILQNALQNRQNRKAEERQHAYNLEMYNMQRRDALADWNMQNQYNSPEEQMRRFKAAGLNPNLIYGQTNTSDAVRSSSAAAAQAIPTQIDLSKVGSMINESVNVQKAKNEADNLQKQGELLDQERQSKAIDLLYKADNAYRENKMKQNEEYVSTNSKESKVEKTRWEAGEQYNKMQDSYYNSLDRKKAFEEGISYQAIVKAKELAEANVDNVLADTNQKRELLPLQKSLQSAQTYQTLMSAELMRLQQAKTKDEQRQIQQNIDNMEEIRKKVIKENGWFDINQWFDKYKGIMTIGSQGVNAATSH